jgi:hypothetical protein
MPSSVEIMNRALSIIGGGRIVADTDDSKEARTCKSNYDIVRPFELRANIWTFATKRAQLPALVTPPPFGYGLAYNMPADCLRVIQVGNFFPGLDLSSYRSSDLSEFTIEGRQILTGLNDGTTAAPSVNVRYIYDMTDAQGFDPCFVEALACRLAMAICMTITESTAKVGVAQELYDATMSRAALINAIELPPSPLPDDTWVMSRNS